MNIGKRIKEIRTAKKISVDALAKELGVSKTTIYRYEDSSIVKIPLDVFHRICKILDVTPAEIMENEENTLPAPELPSSFKNATDAMEFIIKTPTLAAYGGYEPDKMSDETIIEFANELLQQLKLVSYKYKK